MDATWIAFGIVKLQQMSCNERIGKGRGIEASAEAGK